MCATSREIELSVQPTIFLLQIYIYIYIYIYRRYSPRNEAIKFLFTERESCDYDIVMGKSLREDEALNTFFTSKIWNELLPRFKHPSVAVKKVRGRFEYHIKGRDLWRNLFEQ